MDTKHIRPILDWMKTTDLVEVAYKKGDTVFALSTKEAPGSIPHGEMPMTRFIPVSSETVGVFQWAAPGQARSCEEGRDVAANTALAVVVTGSGAVREVLAPCAGRIVKIFADAGEAVEYGRPLFLIEPKA